MMRRAATTDERARKGLTPLAWPHDGGMLRMLIALSIVVLAPALLMVIAELESGGDPRAVTDSYEGVLQLGRGELADLV